MIKHSPGPWRWNDETLQGWDSGGSCWLDDAKEKIVLLKRNDDDLPSAADARLIAAAPTMLELLRDIATEEWLIGTDVGDRVKKILADLDR